MSKHIVSHHVSDERLDSELVRRTIKNWAHYSTPSGLWMPSEPGIVDADSPPSDWGGTYEATKASRSSVLQAHFGDRTDANTALLGVRLSHRPQYWLNLKALGGFEVPMSTIGQVAEWPFLWTDATLKLTACAHKVTKEIVITGRTGPRRFQFALKLAPQHTHTVSNNELRVCDRDGAEWLHSPPAFGTDGAGEPVRVTLTAGDVVRLKGRDYPTVWIELHEQDHLEAALPITIN